jgi:hypothetical protein
MTAAALKPRVDTLEEAMRALAFQSARTQEELQLLSREMRELKDEMAELMEARNPPGFTPRRW